MGRGCAGLCRCSLGGSVCALFGIAIPTGAAETGGDASQKESKVEALGEVTSGGSIIKCLKLAAG